MFNFNPEIVLSSFMGGDMTFSITTLSIMSQDAECYIVIVMLSIIGLSVIMLILIMLCVIMLNVLAPCEHPS
jgi:hypothetical protein